MTPMYADLSPVLLVIPVLVLLAIVMAVAAAKRRDATEATGLLARETVKRDRSGTGDLTDDILSGPTGREVERSAALERSGGGVAVAERKGAAVAEWVAPDPETIGFTRRQFLNRSIIVMFIFGLSVFGAQVIAFLWPQPKGGFGSKINVGKIEDIKAKITAGKGFYYVPEGRMWITAYPVGSIDKAKAVYPAAVLPAMEAGLVALYQKCPHLGCRVPECVSSQWFECPCHGSQYNQAGEKKGGPAPRGMDRFANEVSGGALTVNTGSVFQGPPIGTNTTGQEAEGPHCVGGGGSH